jgi:hypothetical protein
MEHNIASIAGDQTGRDELVRFLAGFEAEPRGEDFWRKRLAFWWDENPFRVADLPRGWVLRCDGMLVGFFGLIPFEYIHQGRTHPALAATTWRVAKAHRQASLPMFLQWHRLGRKYILLDTTANAEVSEILDRFHYRAERKAAHHWFPLAGSGGLKGLALTPLHWINSLSLPRRRLRIVKLTDDFHVNQSCECQERLEKRITRAYLSWYCSGPEARKDFFGCVDGDGVLTSYLIVQPEAYGLREVLSVIDYFTTCPTQDELLALVRHALSAQRERTRDHIRFLLFNVLGNPRLRPGFLHRENMANHYYSLPPHLEGVSKRCVLAEGDYGC